MPPLHYHLALTLFTYVEDVMHVCILFRIVDCSLFTPGLRVKTNNLAYKQEILWAPTTTCTLLMHKPVLALMQKPS